MHVVVRYHEIALKHGNRSHFVRQLTHNIARMLRGLHVRRVGRGPARILIDLSDETDWPPVRERLERVFGIANFFLCYRTERSIEALQENLLSRLGDRRPPSFAIRTKRADKTFPMPSPEISRILGQAVRERTGSRVDLDNPALEIHVEILPREAYFAFEKCAGAGGLPSGSSGRVLALLSGGIDSPVAAFRMMRRGCFTDFVHFHGAPFQSRASQDKAIELAEQLARWQVESTLHLIPFGKLQRDIVTAAPRRLRVVLYRRMMLRIAEAIARKAGAIALVTGESLGQVASQTLPNLAVIEEVTTLPVLRPLIGMDKLEITTHAQRIGTYAISIQPDEDCCKLFVPSHPSTRASPEEVARAEQSLRIDEMVASALAQVQTRLLSPYAPTR